MSHSHDHDPSEAALKLVAFDAEDLAVISAHLQDATVRTGDMRFIAASHRFVLVGSRFDWQAAARGRFERCRTGLHFERVFRVARTGFDPMSETEMTLLAITFIPGDPPSGRVLLHFAAGAGVRLEVECLEAAMADIGPRWAAQGRPDHPLDVQRA